MKTLRIVTAIFLLTILPTQAHAQFTDTNALLVNIRAGDVAWGDYDGDGDLDVAIAGRDGATRHTEIFRNDNGTWVDVNAGLTPVWDAAIAWGDFDNDNDLDIVVAGSSSTGSISTIYRNDGGTFVDIGAGLDGVTLAAAAWGDVDNDGLLDLAVAGYDGSPSHMRVYRNTAGAFVLWNSYEGVSSGHLSFGDLDGNGILDLAVVGEGAAGGGRARVYLDSDPAVSQVLTGVYNGNAAWGDYDDDGDQDLCVAGDITTTGGSLRFYENEGGVLALEFSETPYRNASADWGDFDNDGDRDIVMTGRVPAFLAPTTHVFRNDFGAFTDLGTSGLPLVWGGHAVWGDGDNDGVLEILIAGEMLGPSPFTGIYADPQTANLTPNAPTNLRCSLTESTLILEWETGSDYETDTLSLTYNVRVGTAPGLADIVSPMSRLSDGRRWLPDAGNARHRRFFELDVSALAANELYWSVQTIDAGYQASAFSSEAVANLLFTNLDNAASPVPQSHIYGGSVDWGDYNNDGDLDMLQSGLLDSPPVLDVTEFYSNSTVPTPEDGIGRPLWAFGGSAAWGDYDGDGDLDYVINSGDGTVVHNNDGAGTVTFDSLGSGNADDSVDWGDFDNDGDLDVLEGGRFLENQDGAFIPLPWVPITNGRARWGDYDADGDLDIGLVGLQNAAPVTQVLRNDGGSFVDIGAGLVGRQHATFDWGDYDADGDLDIVVTGLASVAAGGVPGTVIYRNDSGTFVDIGADLIDVEDGDARWGDHDNDGDLDLAVMGAVSNGAGTMTLYRNEAGTFIQLCSGPEMFNGAMAWGDMDNDGDLDLYVQGERIAFTSNLALILRNETSSSNTAPTAPSSLSATQTGTSLTFQWTGSTDIETPTAGITYNIRVGTSPGANDVVPCHSLDDGTRLVVRDGNAGHRLSWTLDISEHPGTPLYWSVQSVDGAWTGSPFATEMTHDIVTGVTDVTPPVFRLLDAAPNPFATSTNVSFSLPLPSRVSVEVFNVRGQRVRTLAAREFGAGLHTLRWDGKTRAGARVASGAYFLRVRSAFGIQTQRLIAVR